jgi:membrane protease YdiL (CAAX protease family)
MSAMPIPRNERRPMAACPAPPPPPRVWPVLVTYAAVFVALLVVIGVFIVNAVLGKVPRGTPPAEVARQMEAFAVSPDGIMAGSLITSVTLLLVALVGGAAAPEGLLRRLGLGLAPLHRRRVLLMLVGMLGISEALGALVDILGWAEKGALGAWAGAIRQFSGPSFLALVMVLGLFAPVAEEMFFRGFIQTRLVARFGAWPGILITAVLFGLLHLDPIHTPLSMVIGIFLGWATVASGTLLVAVLLHAANNVTSAVLTAFLPDVSSTGASLVVFGLSVAAAAAAIWRLQALPPPLAPETRAARVKPPRLSARPASRGEASRPAPRPAAIPAPAALPEPPALSKAVVGGWATCPHCQLRHSRRGDGRCPRCSQSVDSIPEPMTATPTPTPTPTLSPDYVLEDVGRKELKAIRVLMVLVGLLAIGVNWDARSSADERVFDEISAIEGGLRTSGGASERAARLSLWQNPGRAMAVTSRLATLGMGLGLVFLVCAARAGRNPVSATITALAVCSAAHLVFWAADPLGGNAFFGKIDTSEPNLGAVLKVLVAIVLIKGVHTATEYQEAVDFHLAKAFESRWTPSRQDGQLSNPAPAHFSSPTQRETGLS